jgi:hypothetical protein
MKKLKIGNIVRAVFLGTPEPCEVIEVMDKHLYKLRMKSGTILPGVTWYKKLSAKEKKSKPWYIEALINDTTNVKLTKSKDTSKNTTNKNELDKAIKKQKEFIRGAVKK